MTRVTSAIWVSALMRRAQAEGAFVTIAKRGASEAGAIFLIANNLQGEFSLHGPAPQSDYTLEGGSERRFECVLTTHDGGEIEQKISRESSFDPDIWVIEIEDRRGRTFLELIEAPGGLVGDPPTHDKY